ncbi:MAG: Zn-ribbon domain-containing OB-fold protein [Elusimicrobia bacterium]|nr:Zn-ribbon domain-containing OB-fold protein [Elusimicrobiota bacterium]
MVKKNLNLLTLTNGESFQPFRYALGSAGARFFQELKDNNRFMGLRCAKCEKVYIPPRNVCGPCFEPLKDWVQVGPEGSIYSFTVLRFAFIDPETGEKKPVPYGYGFIRLDGASTNLQHFLELPKNGDLKIGMRVRPVFAKNAQGNMRDIVHFSVDGA